MKVFIAKLKITDISVAGVAQLVEHYSVHWKVMGSYPGCGFDHLLEHMWEATFLFFFLYFPLSLSNQ